MQLNANDLIDTARYPISTPGPERDAILSRVRGELAARGCAVLKGFLTPAGIAATVAEADGVAENGHRSFSRTNPYFTAEDDSLPATDPRRRYFDRSNAFVPADNFRPDGALRTVLTVQVLMTLCVTVSSSQRISSFAMPIHWPT